MAGSIAEVILGLIFIISLSTITFTYWYKEIYKKR